MGLPTDEPETRIPAHERSALLPRPYSVSPISDCHPGPGHDSDYRRAFLDEVKTLVGYTLPVFGCVSHLPLHNRPISYLHTGRMFWRYHYEPFNSISLF